MSHTALPTADNTTPALPIFQVPSPAPAPAGITTNSTNIQTPAPVATIEEKVVEFFPPAARLWLYGVCVAVLPLLVAYGKIGGESVALWTDFAAAILGVSGLTVAIANVKK